MTIFNPPQNPYPLTDHQKLLHVITSGDYGCAKFGANPPMGNQKLVYV